MQKKLIASIMLGVSLFISGCSASKTEPPPRTFINTSMKHSVSQKITFRNINTAKIEYTKLEETIDNEVTNSENIFVTGGAISFNDSGINYFEIYSMLNSILDTTLESVAIKQYNQEETIEKLYNNANFISHNNKYLLLGEVNSITEEEYTNDIVKLLKGEDIECSMYFDGDILTEDKFEHIKAAIDKNPYTKVIAGKSSYDATYINRICILGISSKDSKDIGLKVILKLNDKQKIYDIDIY